MLPAERLHRECCQTFHPDPQDLCSGTDANVCLGSHTSIETLTLGASGQAGHQAMAAGSRQCLPAGRPLFPGCGRNHRRPDEPPTSKHPSESGRQIAVKGAVGSHKTRITPSAKILEHMYGCASGWTVDSQRFVPRKALRHDSAVSSCNSAAAAPQSRRPDTAEQPLGAGRRGCGGAHPTEPASALESGGRLERPTSEWRSCSSVAFF